MQKKQKAVENESWRLDFPEIEDIDIMVGNYPKEWFNSVLARPEKKDWTNKAIILVFCGGTIEYNNDLPKDYKLRGFRMLECVLGSFKPKHEHKEHVAGLILESLCK